jgi:hypothetical protein
MDTPETRGQAMLESVLREAEPQEIARFASDVMKDAAEKSQMVEVPLWALKFVLDNGDFWDEGPRDEGWPSDKMSEALRALENARLG